MTSREEIDEGYMGRPVDPELAKISEVPNFGFSEDTTMVVLG
jgi:hypothetical protein